MSDLVSTHTHTHVMRRRMRSCAGSMASAWLTAMPGLVTGLTDMGFTVNVRLRLGVSLLPPLGPEGSCFCNRFAASGTHCLLCSSIWKTRASTKTHWASA